MKIEEGKYYKDGRGEIVGPIRLSKLRGKQLYPWFGYTLDGTLMTWTEAGRYNVASATHYDLVEEVAAPELDGEQRDAAQVQAWGVVADAALRDNAVISTPAFPETAKPAIMWPLSGYERLAGILQEAHDQAAKGKGAERHANDKPFHEQPIIAIGRMCGLGYQTGQIQKKAQEAGGMHARGQHEAATRELLGVINYAAAAILLIRETAQKEQ